MKNLLYRYTVLIVSLFASAIVFNLFIYPTNLVTGGVNGLAVVFSHFFDIAPSIIIFLCSFLMFCLSAFLLGKEETVASILATVLYPFFVSITSNLPKIFIIDTSDIILMSILIGILMGLTNGFMYKVGFSNGGLNIISQVLYKYFHIALSKTTLVINMIVVLLGGIYFGFNIVLYSLIVIYITSFVIDRVILGISNKKAFYIITNEDKKVIDYIIKTMHHSITSFPVKGGFLKKKDQVLLAVVPTREYYKLTEGIKLIDPKAFFVVTDAYEVTGGK